MLARGLRLACVILVSAFLVPSALHSQSMRDVLNSLFVFGEGDDPLFLEGSTGQEATQIHGSHFIPSSSEANSVVLNFFNSAIASNISNFPLSSTSASQTFRFVGGVPTPTSNSLGPIFAERAQTIGRGRLNAGVNYSRQRFSAIRGIDLEAVGLNFFHVNVDFEGCDAAFGGDCSLFGLPGVENDVMSLSLNLDIEADVFAFYATFGLADWLDLSVAVPVIDFSMRGTSVATITSFSNPALHFFGGTQANPDLDDETFASGEATGLGDITARLKALVISGENWDFGLLGEVRAPTGREEDFLGTGEWNAGGLIILSGTFSDFSPHGNIGYEYRGSEFDQDQLNIVLGFDHKIAEWATLAVDFLSAFTVGDQKLVFPQPVRFDEPFRRTLPATNIPDRNDDIIDGSIGFKFRTASGLIIVTNVLVPLNDGGLRSSPVPTLGVEYTL